METELQQEEELISLPELFALLKKNLVKVIGVGLLFAIVGFTVTRFLMTPIYEAKAKMLVNNSQGQSEGGNNDLLRSAENYVSTYAIIIRSRTVLQPIAENLELDNSYESMRDMVTVSPVNNTPVMEITVKNSDPAKAMAILDEILMSSPAIILEAVEAGSVKTIETAYTTGNPVSPSISRNTLIAFVLGLLLAVFIVVVRYLMDNTYSTDLDLQNDLGLPVLGVIPSLESCHEYARKSGRR